MEVHLHQSNATEYETRSAQEITWPFEGLQLMDRSAVPAGSANTSERTWSSVRIGSKREIYLNPFTPDQPLCTRPAYLGTEYDIDGTHVRCFSLSSAGREAVGLATQTFAEATKLAMFQFESSVQVEGTLRQFDANLALVDEDDIDSLSELPAMGAVDRQYPVIQLALIRPRNWGLVHRDDPHIELCAEKARACGFYPVFCPDIPEAVDSVITQASFIFAVASCLYRASMMCVDFSDIAYLFRKAQTKFAIAVFYAAQGTDNESYLAKQVVRLAGGGREGAFSTFFAARSVPDEGYYSLDYLESCLEKMVAAIPDDGDSKFSVNHLPRSNERTRKLGGLIGVFSVI